MKFKLNNNEMLSLIALIELMITNYTQLVNNMRAQKFVPAEQLLSLALFDEMRLTLMRKALIKKDKYTVKLTPMQAVAFWIEFNDIEQYKTQLGNLLKIMCDQIHKQILSK